MQFALAAAFAASVLAVAVPVLAPHHAGLAERSHAAAMWSRVEPPTPSQDPLVDPVIETAP